MPNWVHNTITVRGPDHVVGDFIDFVAGNGTNFCFASIIPRPAKLFDCELGKDDALRHPGRNWLHWSIRRWGTKWEATNHEPVERGEGYATFQFDSAWHAPRPVIDEIFELFPDLHISASYQDETSTTRYGIARPKDDADYPIPPDDEDGPA